MNFPRLQIFLVLALLSSARLTAGYSSIYAFGDGVCTTTDNPIPSYYYYGGRYCNSAVWVEWICSMRGVQYSAAKNISYYGHTSSQLVTNTNNIAVPADAGNSLFLIWCANADFVNFVYNLPIHGDWSSQITNSITNHKTAINTLYNKGARTIVMPNAVDIMRVPTFYYYNQTDKTAVRNKIIAFNTQFESEIAAFAASKPGLRIIRPDAFNFLEGVLANPPAYGMVSYYGQNAVDDTSNPWTEGANFVFWDYMHPTGKFQEALANFVNPLIPAPDTTPPVLTLPGNMVRQSSGASGGATVTFTVTANDAVDGPVVATATPPSASTFPVGTTTVNVSASDAAGNPANGSFKVTVVDMKNLLKNVVITPGGTNPPAISGMIQGGPPGGQVILQASTDMGASDPWQDISTITLDSSGNKSFGPIADPQGSGLPRDFFRIKLPLSP